MATAIASENVHGSYVELDGETYYCIANSQCMPEFYMSLVGADDHWMFVSSEGALTAGRRNPDFALFPYAADDQLSAMRAITGPATAFRCGGEIWIPFADAVTPTSNLHRNLYKSSLGNKVVFEETNTDLHLSFRYRWTFSPRFGFVRDCQLRNLGDASRTVEWVDGLLNLLPHGVGSEFQMRFSNLGNAYKKSEYVEDSRLGLFYLSSIPTDKAEPSEGLRATVVWQDGLPPQATVLSTAQLEHFYRGEPLATESEVRGKPCAYVSSYVADLQAGQTAKWRQVAELSQDQTDVINLDAWIQGDQNTWDAVDADIHAGEVALRKIIASSDGIQCGQNRNRIHRHLANTVFNVMRGGVPLDNYQVEKADFIESVKAFNRRAYEEHQAVLESLPEFIDAGQLNRTLAACQDPDLTRLATEYLPLAFSRRHGDPTRPWNRFSIEHRCIDGHQNLNYQGNWRDIFQNWEALGHSFPEFLPAMIGRFVNATTADGYNAYRITKDGLEWEEPVAEDPWANIGYWCDHQIIYLLKLLEWNCKFHPQASKELLSDAVFVHAEVPYRIKDFEQIKANPRDTIDFDWDRARSIEERVAELGADGKLLRDQSGEIQHVTLVEKLLTLSLAKLSNFVPDGGVWLNTQRPEWNDANNALVGNGLSMVTTCYLHRWFQFLEAWLAEDDRPAYNVAAEVAGQFEAIKAVLDHDDVKSDASLEAATRSRIVEMLSTAGSDYRQGLYDQGPSGETVALSREAIRQFFASAKVLMEKSIRNNRRSDHLYHAYNLLRWTDEGLEVENLYEMLEGQVAVLSAGVLTTKEVLDLLSALKTSRLYRDDQQSYILYPNRSLPTFLTKNALSSESISGNALAQALLDSGDGSILKRDVNGQVHFNGDFRNSTELSAALATLPSPLEESVREDNGQLEQIFDQVFDHHAFTGRSGTFFAYEGLGSIYWHMVSKLGVAVSENIDAAKRAGVTESEIESLKSHLEAIRQGIGAEKSPQQYGAFPSDPYSHTPENAGVKQPGMTGQVKEDVLARFAELGVVVQDGCLGFDLTLFDQNELLDSSREFEFFDVAGSPMAMELPTRAFGFTICQVPVIYEPGATDEIQLTKADGSQVIVEGCRLDLDVSQEIFSRTGMIVGLTVRWAALQRA